MTQETAQELTAIDFTEFDKAIEGAGVFTHVEDAMWVTDKAHELIKVNNSVSTDELSVEKLQEQLNTAKKALTEIASPNVIGAARIPLYRKIASEALAAIGGDGCPAGPVGKNGLTKEELEGSGDE